MFFLSANNKPKVQIDATATTKQAPVLMHVSHEIQQPDQDFKEATKHKLNPLVYPGCEIRSPSAWADPETSQSRPTYVAIRRTNMIPCTEDISITRWK